MGVRWERDSHSAQTHTPRIPNSHPTLLCPTALYRAPALEVALQRGGDRITRQKVGGHPSRSLWQVSDE